MTWMFSPAPPDGMGSATAEAGRVSRQASAAPRVKGMGRMRFSLVGVQDTGAPIVSPHRAPEYNRARARERDFAARRTWQGDERSLDRGRLDDDDARSRGGS